MRQNNSKAWMCTCGCLEESGMNSSAKKTGLLSDFINRACLLATCSICVAMAI